MNLIQLMITPASKRYLNDKRMSDYPMDVASGLLLETYGDDATVSVIFRNPVTGKLFTDQLIVSLAKLIEYGAVSADGKPAEKNTRTPGDVLIPAPAQSSYGMILPGTEVDSSMTATWLSTNTINTFDGGGNPQPALTYEDLLNAYQQAMQGAIRPRTIEQQWMDYKRQYASGTQVKIPLVDEREFDWIFKEEKQEEHEKCLGDRKNLRQIEI